MSIIQKKLEKSHEDLFSKSTGSEVKYIKLEQSLVELTKKDESLKESVIFMNREVEELKVAVDKYRDEQRIARTRILKLERKCKGLEEMDEVREKHSCKMNLWVFEVSQAEQDENTWEVVRDFGLKI